MPPFMVPCLNCRSFEHRFADCPNTGASGTPQLQMQPGSMTRYFRYPPSPPCPEFEFYLDPQTLIRDLMRWGESLEGWSRGFGRYLTKIQEVLHGVPGIQTAFTASEAEGFCISVIGSASPLTQELIDMATRRVHEHLGSAVRITGGDAPLQYSVPPFPPDHPREFVQSPDSVMGGTGLTRDLSRLATDGSWPVEHSDPFLERDQVGDETPTPKPTGRASRRGAAYSASTRPRAPGSIATRDQGTADTKEDVFGGMMARPTLTVVEQSTGTAGSDVARKRKTQSPAKPRGRKIKTEQSTDEHKSMNPTGETFGPANKAMDEKNHGLAQHVGLMAKDLGKAAKVASSLVGANNMQPAAGGLSTRPLPQNEYVNYVEDVAVRVSAAGTGSNLVSNEGEVHYRQGFSYRSD